MRGPKVRARSVAYLVVELFTPVSPHCRCLLRCHHIVFRSNTFLVTRERAILSRRCRKSGRVAGEVRCERSRTPGPNKQSINSRRRRTLVTEFMWGDTSEEEKRLIRKLGMPSRSLTTASHSLSMASNPCCCRFLHPCASKAHFVGLTKG